MAGEIHLGYLLHKQPSPSALFSSQVCPPAQLTWGMTWGTGLRHDDCALVWAAALLWDSALTLRVLLWQSNGDTSLCMDRVSRQEATISYCTEQKDDINVYLYTHYDFSLSGFQRTRPRNHSQPSHSCRLCHFLAAHPQHWLWQVHCLLQPHDPSATIHHVHLQGPSFRRRCFMAFSYAYTESCKELSPLYLQKLLNLSLKCSYLYGIML